jgi:hypothetical protein
MTCKKIFLSLAALFLLVDIQAQAVLGDPINDGILPDDTDEICALPIYPEIELYSFPYAVGDTVNDFTLFDLDGVPYTLSEILLDGKPVVLIGASYTCYVFRDKIPVINEIQETYGDAVNIFITYTAEAHPAGDVSPYFGFEAVGEQNIEDGVIFPQPEAYGERKGLVNEMLTDLEIDVPVLIDGPCNEYWLTYGTYPNHAYILNPNGTVYEFQDWFDKYPANIFTSLNNLLNEDTVITEDPVGAYILEEVADSCIVGDPGSTIIAHVDLTNIDIVDAEVEIFEYAEIFPEGWLSSICTDICYPPDVVSSTITVPAGETVGFSYYFYTNETPGEGEIQLIVRQAFDYDMAYFVSLKACTEFTEEEPVSIEVSNSNKGIKLFPNPATDYFVLQTSTELVNNSFVQLYNANGSLMLELPVTAASTTIPVDGLVAGIYQVVLMDATGSSVRTLVIQ